MNFKTKLTLTSRPSVPHIYSASAMTVTESRTEQEQPS